MGESQERYRYAVQTDDENDTGPEPTSEEDTEEEEDWENETLGDA
tara:strand:- start:662 stop:796 length:135 start_codon:yes stop_codon:yes gene_type:complete